ncbi:hypothetical protein [Cupriavidus taiwanensis]|uniref:hypothetical protein n=1 Tax=Cupriavidus taiwanensis TaxID=164546 RepID=UPI000E1069D7|nr:hypothetical protein [Cupriavidus taiwanensis]SOY56801.1 hypothetical protein CBM2592_A90096 [Cupriavidus taiwanensis]SOY90702.1 hypothetical protein CBM2591_A90095 [Cupriavidus taiwanensis]SOZ63508.1 hypothetical protein CBM2617_A70072 [Cupriavidus taiwanensis]SOZ82512.1 hypothetical protein CBM2618_A80072 [Cupriavidus taiwanensis]SOZ84393.1 hypothetical protein CBM2622_A80072 [Cupriavidus taiwanensis]
MESLTTGHWLPDEHGDVVHARLLPDVRLLVHGEFDTLERKVAAARWIAHCLNVAIDATPADENPAAERIYVGGDGVSLSPTPGAVAYVRADVAATLSQMTGQLAELINSTVVAHNAELGRILDALEVPAHVAVSPDECQGYSTDKCFEMGARQGGTAVRLAIKDAVAQAMKYSEG